MQQQQLLITRHLPPDPKLHPGCLANDFEIFDLDAECDIKVDKGPIFLVEFPIETCKPAAAFDHPNCARKVARKLNYKYDNPKRWVEKDGTCFFFAIPREYIVLLPEPGYSWPHRPQRLARLAKPRNQRQHQLRHQDPPASSRVRHPRQRLRARLHP